LGECPYASVSKTKRYRKLTPLPVFFIEFFKAPNIERFLVKEKPEGPLDPPGSLFDASGSPGLRRDLMRSSDVKKVVQNETDCSDKDRDPEAEIRGF
jgi:hypothetical protein